MAITASIWSATLVDGRLHVTIAFNEGQALLYKRTTILDDVADGDLNRWAKDESIREIARFERLQIAAGARQGQTLDLAPAVAKQEDLDRDAFLALCDLYRNRATELAQGLGKTTAEDLDAIRTEIKQTYNDDYARYVVGLFE